MAVKLPDGKIARTQPEQVKKNMDDIESMKSELVIIKEGIASAYKIQGSEDVANLNALEKAEDMNGYVYNMLDAGNLVNEDASTLSVQIGDNVVFVWNGGDWYWDRLAGLVDTSNLCTLDTDQTITGIKTFSYGLKIDDTKLSRSSDFNGIEIENDKNLVLNGIIYPKYNNSRDIGASSYAWKDLYLSGTAYIPIIENSSAISFKINGTERFKLTGADAITGRIYPSLGNTFDIGTASYKYKDLYLNGIAYLGSGSQITQSSDGSLQFTLSGDGKSVKPSWSEHYDLGAAGYKWRNVYLHGNLSDGTNSVAVAAIPKKVLYVDATHAPTTAGTIQILTWTLNAANMALIDTTKPIMLVAADEPTYTKDICLGFAEYNSGTGVLSYLNYSVGQSITSFWIMQ